MVIQHFVYFFQTLHLWQKFFGNIIPMICRVNIKIYFFMLRRLHSNVTFFFYKQHFYKEHHAEIWFEVITVSCIKGKHSNGRFANWTALLLQNPLIKPSTKWSVYLFFLSTTPLYVLLTPFPFLQENLDPPSMIFKIFQLPINKGWSYHANERHKIFKLAFTELPSSKVPKV